jgi:hypothetical protein
MTTRRYVLSEATSDSGWQELGHPNYGATP